MFRQGARALKAMLRRGSRAQLARGAIDWPTPGLVVTPRLLQVHGWVLPAAPPTQIRVLMDGRVVGFARPFSGSRPDVAERSPAPYAPISAFEYWARVSGAPGARVRCEVEVEDLDGSVTSLPPVDITVGAPDEDERASPSAPVSRVAASARRASADARRSPPRLVVFTHRLTVGGAQLYLRELLEQLLGGTVGSCLVISAEDGPLRAPLEALGAEIVIGDFPVATLDAYEAAVSRFVAVVEHHGADIVLVHTMLSGLGADVAQRLGIPTIWLIRENLTLDEFWISAYGDAGIDPGVRAALTKALAQAETTVHETEASRAALANICPADRGVVVAHDLGLDRIAEQRDQMTKSDARRQLGIDTDRFVILNVGSIEPHKGQAALVFAFAHIADEVPHACLVLVGDAGNPYAHAVRQSITRLGLADRIHMEETVADPLLWYRAADAFVLPSDQENLPRTLLEAMASELPCAATRVGGIPEVLDHGRNGLLFAPRDLSALIGVLRDLVRMSADDRATLGAAGARDVRARQQQAAELETFRSLFATLDAGHDSEHPE